MEQIRAFIAIELPQELRQGLEQLQARLKTANQPAVKWVNPNGIHLTLKFLGNIAAARTGEITQAMQQASQGISPFPLKVGGLGVFPNLKRVQVIWVGISGEIDKLSKLQQGIESALKPLGFIPESRSFTPHLTLARLRGRASDEAQQRLGQLIASTRLEPTYTIEVDAINLMRSQLTREGAIYTQISSVGLK